MPTAKLTDLPAGGDGNRWPICARGFRSTRWGDLHVGHTVAGPMTAAPTYDYLPGKVCQCPHYGYVFSGRIRCVFPGTDWPDEVAEAGDVYFFRAGHHLVYEERTEALEMNPADALEFLMDHVEAHARARMAEQLSTAAVAASG